jgi:hypothetical protein
MYDVAATIRFYIDYLGCSLDWQSGEGDRPVYLQVSRAGVRLHLSSHHDDGTPGTAVLVEVRNIDALHAELHKRGYPFFNPGIGPGPGNARDAAHRPCLQPDSLLRARTSQLRQRPP